MPNPVIITCAPTGGIHTPTIMSPEEHEEEGTMLICVGRARSARLILDL